MGAPGPLVSLVIVSLTVQIIPTLLYSRGRERSGKPVLVIESDSAERPVAPSIGMPLS
jgi:hypothetical protein